MVIEMKDLMIYEPEYPIQQNKKWARKYVVGYEINHQITAPFLNTWNFEDFALFKY